MVYGGIEKMNRKLIVGGSVGAVALLVLMSFNSVAALNVHQQTIAEKYNLVREHVYHLSSADPKFDIFTILEILAILFDLFLSLIVWFYDKIFGWG